MEPALINSEKTHAGTGADLDRLLRPRSIALVGASSTAGSLADCVLTNLEDAGFPGELHLVNPKRPVIHGRQCLGSIDELPSGVDCAVLAIPGAAVLDAVRACAAKAVGSVIVFSAGFAESGEAGAAAQAELASIARQHGMLLNGPNCLGIVNYLHGVPITFVMTPPQPAPAIPGAAILSQSGALAAVIAVNMRHHHIPLTYSVSTGNEAVLGVEDLLESLLGNSQTRVFTLVVEQFRQPQRFLDLARRAAQAGQHIVLLHPGRSKAARASAATHTGAIAGDYDVMRTLVTHAGVFLVESLEELVDVTQLLVRCHPVPSGGAAVFTESGAFKAVALDLCDQAGLPLPLLAPATEDALRKALPPFIPPSNPLDLTAQGLVDPDLYRRTLPPVLADESFASVLLAIILTDERTTRLKLPPIVGALTEINSRKPVLFAALDEGAPFNFPELGQLRALGVPCFPSAERAIRALARVSARTSVQREGTSHLQSAVPLPVLRSGTLSEVESKAVLRHLGIATPPGEIAGTPADALRIAAEIGYPVALKAHSAALAHKTEAGGVLLNIANNEELAVAWHTLHRNVHAARPELVLEGVLVERMAAQGIELIVGARRDPQWGPILLIGFGGVLAEIAGDGRLLPPDLSVEQIACELQRLRCAPLLRGFRGAPPVDTAAVARTVAALGSWMLAEPRVLEVDINPLVVTPRGALALDALICIAENSPTGKEGQTL
ncbi:acetate--CoA ligase family protein [Acidobacteria bacterium AB60]|nr:acetate--CoA ligase family protein [Acidobacteria bacterium AB60]